MKLPDIAFKTGVKRFPSQRHIAVRDPSQAIIGSPSDALLGAQAQIAAMNAIGATAETISNVVNTYSATKNKIAVRNANTGYNNSNDNFELIHSKKVEYTRDDVPPELYYMFENREIVPAYEIRPELFRLHSKSMVEHFSNSIPSTRVRNQWIANAQKSSQDIYHKLAMESVKEQRMYDRQHTIDGIKEDIDRNQYQEARQKVVGFDGTTKEKEDLLDTIDRREEYNTNYEILGRSKTENNISEMQLQMEFLAFPEQGEKDKYTGKLGNKERLSFLNSYQSAINNIVAKQTSEALAGLEMHKRDLRLTTDALLAGNVDVPIEEITRLETNQKAYNTVKPGVNAALWRDFNIARDMQPVYNVMKKLRVPDVNAVINDPLASKALMDKGYTAGEASEIITQMKKAGENFIHLQNTNTMQAAENAGIINAVPWDITDLGSLMVNRENWDIAHTNYGQSQGPMKPEAAKYTVQLIENAKTENERINYFGNIATAFGADSYAVYDQLSEHGLEGSYVYAGNYYSSAFGAVTQEQVEASKEQLTVAEHINSGQQILNTPDVEILSTQEVKGLQDLFNKRTSAYGANYRAKASAWSAFKAHYVYNKTKKGMNLPLEEYDEDSANSSLETFSGGYIQINDKWFEPPLYKYGQDQMDIWMRELSPERVQAYSNGVPEGYTYKQISDNRYRFEFHPIGKDHWSIEDTGLDKDNRIRTKDGQLFLLNWIPHGTVIPDDTISMHEMATGIAESVTDAEEAVDQPDIDAISNLGQIIETIGTALEFGITAERRQELIAQRERYEKFRRKRVKQREQNILNMLGKFVPEPGGRFQQAILKQYRPSGVPTF